MSQPTDSYVLKLYPVENEYIACLDTSNMSKVTKKTQSKTETVVILDRSGSMCNSVYKIIHSVLPKFFEFLSYDPETVINLIAFESSTKLHKIKVGDFASTKMYAAGGTSMSPAVAELHKLFKDEFESKVSALRILTISDGEVWDQEETKKLGDQLADYANRCNISVNSQAVRFFTSRLQPDTTALCSLLQLSNVNQSKMLDVGAQKHHEKIAKEMAELFENDGFDEAKTITASGATFYKYPWDEEPMDKLLILPGRKNVFWTETVPESVTIDGVKIPVTVETNTTLDQFQLLLNTKLDFIIDRMKILKIVNTDAARLTIEKIVEYFTRIENFLAGLVTDVVIDPKSIANRGRLLKLDRIRTRKITTFLQTIANDDEVHKLNAAQKADYLRSVQASSKAGRGLAKRNAKRKNKIGAKQLSFDEIVRNEVLAIKSNFHELKDIDYKNHSVSFYSQATTMEGLSTLVEFTSDPSFPNFTAEELLQFVNIVGVACNSPVGDFPDASTWRVNEIYYGCFLSVADLITSFHQSSDTGFALKAPGIDREITNVIPVFDDPRIGVFLKKYAPSILEFSSSIGMRRVIADVSMTFGYNIIAGIRRMTYDLNKSRSTVHLETFKQLVSTAASFVGKYYDHIEELLTAKDSGIYSYYLGNSGTASLIVPLIRMLSKKNHPAVDHIPDILRSIYSYEIWKGISKEFKGKQKFNEITKDMLYKLLKLDIKVPADADEPAELPDDYTVDQEYLDKLTQPLYYHNYMTLLPRFLKAVTSGNLEDIKEVPEMTKSSVLEVLGIDYDYKEFIFLNVFQALRYPRGSARADHKEQKMKVIDLRFHKEAVEDVKNYVRSQYKAAYDTALRTKKRNEEEEVAKAIVSSMIKEESYTSMLNIWRNGIERNGTVYKISNSSSAGFKELCLKLVDMKVEIPLRSQIIKILLLGTDNDGQPVYNNGEVCDIKLVKKYKKRFLLTGSAEEWSKIEEEITKRNVHKYRGKLNRRGHGNEKPSFWAVGHKNPLDFLLTMTEKEQDKYLELHQRCCNTRIVRYSLW